MHGLSIVARNECAGVNQLVENEITGILVDDGDDVAGSLAAGLRRLISAPLDEDKRVAGADRLAERLAPALVYS